MKADAILIIVLFAVVVSFVMAIYNWRTNKNSLYLAAFLSILSLEAYSSWNYHEGNNPFVYTLLFNHVAPLFTLKAPLLFFFVRGNIRDNYSLSRRDLWHFLPALLHLFFIVPYIFVPFSEKLQLVETLLAHPELYTQVDLGYPYPHILNLYFRGIQLLVYAIVSLILIVRFMKSSATITGELKSVYRFSSYWMIVLLSILIIIAILQTIMIGQTALTDNLIDASNRATAVFKGGIFIYILIPIVFIAYPKFLYGFPSFKFIHHYSSSTTSAIQDAEEESTDDPVVSGRNYSSKVFNNLDVLNADILAYMETEQPYLNPDFKIADIAYALGIPLHHVQLCISMKIGKKFADFKNEYRVQYAQQLMLDPERRYTLEAIGEKSGFASNSNFYDTFRSITGTTPRQWYLTNVPKE
jgi:AraC-like DNA-binding protein